MAVTGSHISIYSLPSEAPTSTLAPSGAGQPGVFMGVKHAAEQSSGDSFGGTVSPGRNVASARL